jgi:hypothetical protein
MSEQDAILLSIILNMAIDGKCDLSKLSPNVAAYVEGILEDYYEDVEDNEAIYWYAYEKLDYVPKKKLH